MIGILLLGTILGGVAYGSYHLIKKIKEGVCYLINKIKEKKKSKKELNDEKENKKDNPEEQTKENKKDNPEEQTKENDTQSTLEQIRQQNIEKGCEFWQLNDIYSNFKNKNYNYYYNNNVKRTKNPYRLTFVSNIIRYVEENYGPSVAEKITFDNINHYWGDTMYFNSNVFDPKLGHKVLKKTKLIEFYDKNYCFYYPDGKKGHFTGLNLGAGLSLLDKKLEYLGVKKITRKQYEEKLADKFRQKEKQIKENDGYKREISFNVR